MGGRESEIFGIGIQEALEKTEFYKMDSDGKGIFRSLKFKNFLKLEVYGFNLVTALIAHKEAMPFWKDQLYYSVSKNPPGTWGLETSHAFPKTHKMSKGDGKFSLTLKNSR